jgi:hypothetical protein
MNLNELAESDLQFTLEDATNGFGVSLVFKNTSNADKSIICQTTDIGFFIDPQTGDGVQSRTVEVVGRITTFDSNVVTIVKGAAVKYYDTKGNNYTTVIRQITTDRKLGVHKIILEAKT